MAPQPDQPGKIVRVGIVGTGSVAQVVHLPTLALMSHLYKVTAVCDISAQSRGHSAKKWGIPKAFASSAELVKQEDVDVVFVLNNDEYHAPTAIEAANAGKHVFIEKPMALTHEDAQAIAEAGKRNNVVIFVGYMRRYAPALAEAIKLIGGRESLNYARIRDIIGPNAFFIGQSGTFPLAFTDIPESALSERDTLSKDILTKALGTTSASDPVLAAVWRFLGGLGSHDLAVMREALGMPQKVLGAGTNCPEGRWVTALFQYDGFVCTYETGVDTVGKFDAHIELYGKERRVRVDYDTPFIKGLPITITVMENVEGSFVERKITPTYEDPYTLEMKELWDAIVEGKQFKTTVQDAMKDLDVFDMVIGALKSPSSKA